LAAQSSSAARLGATSLIRTPAPDSLPARYLVPLEGSARQLSGQPTLPGEPLRVRRRVPGPVLLGLALLSIRSRVKR
jgi:hypothetical protein